MIVQNNNINQIKVHFIRTGSVLVDETLTGQGDSRNPIAFTGLFRSSNHRVEVPVSCYLIEHPKGLVLIDTGMGKEAEGKVTPLPGLVRKNKVAIPNVKVGELIDDQIKELGFNVSDIDYVILSHLDGDHAGGLQLLKEAKTMITSNEEYQKANQKHSIRYNTALWQGTSLQPFYFKDTHIGPQKKSFDLFGDGTITLVHTPGHSVGLTSFIIKSLRNDDYILLASDVGYYPGNWRELRLPGILSSKKQEKRSLQWVQNIEKDRHCLGIYANHDPNVTIDELSI